MAGTPAWFEGLCSLASQIEELTKNRDDQLLPLGFALQRMVKETEEDARFLEFIRNRPLYTSLRNDFANSGGNYKALNHLELAKGHPGFTGKIYDIRDNLVYGEVWTSGMSQSNPEYEEFSFSIDLQEMEHGLAPCKVEVGGYFFVSTDYQLEDAEGCIKAAIYPPYRRVMADWEKKRIRDWVDSIPDLEEGEGETYVR